jgi:HAD superfamily hydrolase (TIGR01509 family)
VAVFVRHISRDTVIFINTTMVKTGHRLYYTLVAFAAPGAAFAPPSASSPLRILGTESANAATATTTRRAVAAAGGGGNSLEAILFDCDGVLADTERDGHRVSFNIAFEASGIDEAWDEDRYGKLLEVGGGKERMTAHWVSRESVVVPVVIRDSLCVSSVVLIAFIASLYGQAMPDTLFASLQPFQNEVGWPDQIPEGKEDRAAKVKQLHLQKTDVFMKLIDEGRIPLRPGVLRLVDEAISNGLRLAVCSTSSELAVRNLVRKLMGEDRASKFRIFAGDMVKSKKPSPDIYQLAVDEMELNKDRCVIIEDSHIGVRAAVAAGISCLVTKSSYTAMEDFTGAKMIVDELGDEINIEILTGLLRRDASPALGEDGGGLSVALATAVAPGAATWDRVLHVEKGSASWTGARFGDDNVNRPYVYTPSETYEASGPRGIGVKMESHIEKGGASWTGARFGEGGGPSASYSYTPSETYEASGPRGIGVKMESHIEKGGASWTGARFGEGDSSSAAYSYTPSETYQASGPRGIGVKMESHIEKGGASWTGARFGDQAKTIQYSYTASETYEFKSRGKGTGARWDTVSHVEGDENTAWNGARFAGDKGGYQRAAPTPSQWRE